jgi:hypothetical protein
MLLTDGGIGTMRVGLDGEATFVRSGEIFEIGEDCVFASNGGNIAVLSRRRNEAKIVVATGVIASFTVFTKIGIVGSIRARLVFCPDECTVEVIEKEGKRTVLCQTEARIGAITVAVGFRVVVVATLDGMLRICDSVTGQRVRKVDIGGSATMIAVTPTWGYIMAVADGVISILNINGLAIAKKRVAERFRSWRPFTTVTDFDYMLVETEGKGMGYFHALRPESLALFHELKEPLAAVEFDRKLGAFIFITRTGHVIVLPHPLIV